MRHQTLIGMLKQQRLALGNPLATHLLHHLHSSSKAHYRVVVVIHVSNIRNALSSNIESTKAMLIKIVWRNHFTIHRFS